MPNYHRPIRCMTAETDGQLFIPATLEYSFGGTWTKTRSAAGDYNMLKTAAADTTQTVFNLSRALFSKIGADPNLSTGSSGTTSSGPTRQGDEGPSATARVRGVRLTSLDVVWKNTTADLTSGTVDLHRTTHTSQTGANPTVLSTVGGTLTGDVVTVTASANTRIETVTLATPYILSNNTTRVTDWCEIAWIAAATSVLTVYGIFINFDYNIH